GAAAAAPSAAAIDRSWPYSTWTPDPAPVTDHVWRAIPYFAWANRGAGPMRVWLPEISGSRGPRGVRGGGEAVGTAVRPGSPSSLARGIGQGRQDEPAAGFDVPRTVGRRVLEDLLSVRQSPHEGLGEGAPERAGPLPLDPIDP